MKLRLIAISVLALILLGFGPSGQDPARLEGEPELVSKTDEGWATVKFPDLGITVELPHWPTQSEMEWDDESRKTVKSWGAYDFESKKVNGDVYVYEAAGDAEFSAGDMREQEIATFEDERVYTNVKVEKGEMTVGNHKVLTVRVSYLEGIDAATAQGFFWESGKKAGAIRLSWWSDEDSAGKAVAEHIEHSLRID